MIDRQLKEDLQALTEGYVEETRLELPEYEGDGPFIGLATEKIRRLFAAHRKNALTMQDETLALRVRNEAAEKMMIIDVAIRVEVVDRFGYFEYMGGEGGILPTRNWKLYWFLGPNPFHIHKTSARGH
jgi:hypothetical protein